MEKSPLLVIDMQIGAVRLENPKFYKIDELIVRLKGLIERASPAGGRFYAPGPAWAAHGV